MQATASSARPSVIVNTSAEPLSPGKFTPAWDEACLIWLKGRGFINVPAPSETTSP